MKLGANWQRGFRREVTKQYHDFIHVYSTETREDNPCRIKF